MSPLWTELAFRPAHVVMFVVADTRGTAGGGADAAGGLASPEAPWLETVTITVSVPASHAP